MLFQHHIVLFVLKFLVLFISISTTVFADKEIQHEVEDLPYGLSLFHFYQGKYFSAITDILVAQHYDRLNSNDKNPQLLLGSLYLSYGLQHKSAAVFSRIINEEENISQTENPAPLKTETKNTSPWTKKVKIQVKTPQYIRDRAWFHLGKNHYQNGFIKEAETALTSVKDTLSTDYESERLFLLIEIYTQSNRLKEARQAFDNIDDDSIWYLYSKFNLAVSLIKNNAMEDGISLLKDIATNQTLQREHRILQDKANLALAYTALKSGNAIEAAKHFETVRLNDTEATKALLGIGWAWYQQSEYDKSLTPWMELANRDKSDPSVQEALISIPNSFEKINNHFQALHQYDLAIKIYQKQLLEVNKVLKSIHSGEFIEKLKISSLGKESATPFNILFDINASSNQYLLPLITSKEFHDALKTYQEIEYLSYTLNHWKQGLPALDLILREKTKRYNEKLGGTLHNPKIKLANNLQSRRHQLASKLIEVSQNEDTLSLATIDEQKNLQSLFRLRRTIDKNISDLEEEDEKQSLLYGLLYWEIATDFNPRLWNAQKNLKELDAALYKMNGSMHSLNDAWKNTPDAFKKFAIDIREKKLRIDSLKSKMRKSLVNQEKHLKNMALKVIIQQRDRLNLYTERALFSRARIYDSLIVK